MMAGTSEFRFPPPPLPGGKDRRLGARDINQFIRRKIRDFFDSPWVGGFIILMILLSILSLIIEFSLPPGHHMSEKFEKLGDFFTLFFALELLLRFYSLKRRSEFLKNYWIDLLAIIPVFRIFRLGRAFSIFRLIRIFRIGSIIAREVTFSKKLLRSQQIEFLIVGSFVMFAVLFGTLGMLHFEKHETEHFKTFSESFWWSVFTLVSGEISGELPKTFAGKLTGLVVIIFGMGFFAALTGTFSAIMVERFKNLEGNQMDFEELEKHVVICGISRAARPLLEELFSFPESEKPYVVLISEKPQILNFDRNIVDPSRIYHLQGDFTRVDVLQRANIKDAAIAIVLADRGENRSYEDTDARTILTCLTIERLAGGVYTCAELLNRDYEAHLRLGGVDEVIISSELAGHVLALSSRMRGIGRILSPILSASNNICFSRIEARPSHIGKEFSELLPVIKKEEDALLVGIERNDEGNKLPLLFMNPSSFTIQNGDRLIVLTGPGTGCQGKNNRCYS